MVNLAIKGHKTRGEEVIELLKMLGGNGFSSGQLTTCAYFINNTGTIHLAHINGLPENYVTFTLEEFIEKFPYKVGDRVKKANDDDGYCATVISMDWDSVTSEVIYTIIFDDHIGSTLECLSVDLQLYKEETFEECIEKTIDIRLFGKKETMEEQTYLNPKVNEEMKKIKENLKEFERILKEQIKIDIPKGYEFAGVDNQQIVLKKIEPKYPKTYEECCNVLNISESSTLYVESESKGTVTNCAYSCSLVHNLGNFRKLIICRDAYWKIAGEQMGLGKPWEPDFTNNDEERYGIYTIANKVEKDFCGVGDVNMILTFPTEEMRNLFYDNFKDLIEKCKKLL